MNCECCITYNAPDLMDGGVTAARTEEEAEPDLRVDYEAMWWKAEGEREKAEENVRAREEMIDRLDALVAAEHRATRAEAQAAIRGRAVAIYQARAREAEAQSAAWAKQYEHDMGQENRRADEAEARIKAAQDVLNRHAHYGLVEVDDISHALDG